MVLIRTFGALLNVCLILIGLLVSEPLLAHTDGVTKARLTVKERQGFYLELLNFDLLNCLSDTLYREDLSVDSILGMDDESLQATLNRTAVKFQNELVVYDANGRSFDYHLEFPSLVQVKNQFRIKKSLAEEPSFIVKLRGKLRNDNDQLHIKFPESLNQVSLKKVIIDTLHIPKGAESTDLFQYGAGNESIVEVFIKYVRLGFEHIIPKGIDHILFVLGIFLLSYRFRPLVWQISAFTLAHAITLALTMYDVISLPSHIVETVISLSVAFVAFENIIARKMTPWRPVLVFVFGLLHGMGFAGVLSDLGLPETNYIGALVAFNVGVELGQLAVVGAAFVMLCAWFSRPWYRQYICIPLSAIIGVIGLYWAVDILAINPFGY